MKEDEIMSTRCLVCNAIYSDDMNSCPSCGSEKGSKKTITKEERECVYNTVKQSTQWEQIQSEQKRQRQKQQKYNTTHGAECPYCKSTDTQKISTSSKVAHTAVFGLFSISRNTKQWHCNHCKSNF